jgi:hypothetical protein
VPTSRGTNLNPGIERGTPADSTARVRPTERAGGALHREHTATHSPRLHSTRTSTSTRAARQMHVDRDVLAHV